MFLTHRPSAVEIKRFIDQSQRLPLSYHQIGIARESPLGYQLDESSAVIGHGMKIFAASQDALRQWRQFQLGWVELHPSNALLEPETVVAVLVRHLGFWSLNGCRVVYLIGDDNAFGFAYGTLTNHVERGEEIFEVKLNPESQEVSFVIRAVSQPRAALARAGYPITRLLQRRFREDSIRALRRAIGQ